MKTTMPPLSNVSLVLHDIRSVLNTGAIFRTAEAFGVGEIVVSGYTPGPLDRFERKRNDFGKVSLGAEDSIPWRRIGKTQEVIETLRREEKELLVLEQDKRAIDIRDLRYSKQKKENIALVVGNEVEGVDQKFIKAADTIVEIPIWGKKESFNVASAAAIAIYALSAQ
ncbi:MAG: TrmH family RNA methyltransferase [Candidatus Campbellbacteria bacterium]|nr:TrmH family RNA methyltransferase [Candidatus Campbellbacteria bacterium]